MRINNLKKQISDLKIKNSYKLILNGQLDQILRIKDVEQKINILITFRNTLAGFEKNKILTTEKSNEFRSICFEISGYLEFLIEANSTKLNLNNSLSIFNFAKDFSTINESKISNKSSALIYLEINSKIEKGNKAYENLKSELLKNIGKEITGMVLETKILSNIN